MQDDLLSETQQQQRRKRPTMKLHRWLFGFFVMLALLIRASVANLISTMQDMNQKPAPRHCVPSALTLVQSIPLVDFAIGLVKGSMPTHEAMVALADGAQRTLDFTAMYMDLNGTEDREVFSPSEMEAFGIGRGVTVFDALKRAAERNVAIRILLGTLNNPINSSEVRALLAFPNVQARTWDPTGWYGGGGIMHLKVWHADQAAAYLGSANTDWKSLAQVKEIGVLINGTSDHDAGVIADIGRLYNVFWEWANPSLTPASVVSYSERYQANLTVPAWDIMLPAGVRDPAAAPFGLSTSSAVAALTSQQDMQPLCSVDAVGQGGGDAAAFVSASPGGAVTAGRTPDIDALLYTIRSATSDLSLSVMDFLPASAFSGGHGTTPVWWPALIDAILAVAYAKPVRVRVLVSHWAHTKSQQTSAMARLSDGLAACEHTYVKCAGTLEVRQYFVPGWNTTKPSASAFPSFSRVNHAKYIVSDQRLNIGTSNWQWGYFHNTAGASFNTDAATLVAAAQSVFDADWASPYASPLYY